MALGRFDQQLVFRAEFLAVNMLSLKAYQTWIIVLAAILSRVPQLTSPLLLLDSDECVVGLMAKHFYDGKELPLFFYGQTYGFSFVEVLAIYPFYFTCGVSDISVKLGMLCLWILGVILFKETLKNLQPANHWLPFLFSLVLVFAPPWAVWSMKARGGYLTAFVLTSLILFIITRTSVRTVHWLLVAVLIVLLYESQPLWLPGLYPFLMYYLVRDPSWRPILATMLGSTVTACLFQVLKRNLPSVWSPPGFTFNDSLAKKVVSIPRLVYENMTGSYRYSELIDMGWATNFWAACFTACIFVGLATGVLLLIRKKHYPLLYISCMAVTFNLGYLCLISDYSPRYLLPLAGYALIMLFTLLNTAERCWANAHCLGASILAAVLVLDGAVSLFHFRNYKSEAQDRSGLQRVSAYLTAHHVRHAICRYPMHDWQITFYSQEQITATNLTLHHRYPKYMSQVTEACRSHEPCATIDFYHPHSSQAAADGVLIANTYIVDLNPTKDELRQYGLVIEDE